jgi:ubiquinone biosynthesis monooxygenase Coq6
MDPSALVRLINAAFRIPEVSLRYLHQWILERERSGSSISPSEIQQEISWRERSHGIHERSAYSSSNIYTAESGVPPEDACFVPPGVTSIQPGSVASFPVRFSHADSYIGDEPRGRTVLIGDAAHTIHPLAGQGLNIGLGDVESLSRCIETAVIQGGDIGKSPLCISFIYLLIPVLG